MSKIIYCIYRTELTRYLVKLIIHTQGAIIYQTVAIVYILTHCGDPQARMCDHEEETRQRSHPKGDDSQPEKPCVSAKRQRTSPRASQLHALELLPELTPEALTPEICELSVEQVLQLLLTWTDEERAGEVLICWWAKVSSRPWAGETSWPDMPGWASAMAAIPLLSIDSVEQMSRLGRIVGMHTSAYDDEEAGGIASAWAAWGQVSGSEHAALVGAFLNGFCKCCRGGCGRG
jgi:hypothetical protein